LGPLATESPFITMHGPMKVKNEVHLHVPKHVRCTLMCKPVYPIRFTHTYVSLFKNFKTNHLFSKTSLCTGQVVL